MQRSPNVPKAKGTKADPGKVSIGEDGDTQVNLAIERAKYKSFWVGVNRGINLDSKNPRVLEDEYKKKDSDEPVRSKGLFEANGPWKLVWSAYITILILYSVVIIPVRLGFEPKVAPPFEVLENIVSLSFAVDILVHFNTTYQVPGTEHVVHNRHTIVYHYLQFWFWIDLISTIPFSVVGSWFATANVSVLRGIKMLRLLRIVKLFRIHKFDETLQSLRINQHVISLVVLLLGIFFIAHLFACGWHYMALEKEQTTGGETWVNELGYADKNVYDLYVASLYFVMVTMMTVGFGDIHPVTDNERIYAIATMLTGGVVFGAMISRLALILEKRNPESKALRQNLTEIKTYLVDVGLPAEMRRKVVDAYKYYLHKKSVFGEPTFFEDLPQPILYRLVKQLNEDDIRSVKLFHTYEMEFVVALLLALKPFQAMAGETIFSEGDICDTIVFLKKGKVAVSASNGFKNVLAGYVRAGGHFGDMEYLRNTTCIATYAASKHSQLLSVTHTTVNQAAVKCLDAGVRFRKETELRYKLFNQVIKQNKRDQDQGYAQYSLEESRAIVGKLMHQSSGSTPVPTPRATPRRRSSLQTPSFFTDKESAAPKTEPKKEPKKELKPKKSLTPTAVSMMWIDGVIVDTRNLTLLARNADQFANEVDETTIRVIYRNAMGKIGPGEVPESYLHEHLIINPLHGYKVAWDLLIAVMVVYSIVIIPMEIAFDSYAFAGSETVDIVTNSFYLLDIVLCFRTAYFEDEGDYLVVVPYLVAKKYLLTWCFVDLLGSLPFDVMFRSFSSTNLAFTKLLKVIRLARLFKLARLLKVGHVSEQVEEKLNLSPTVMSLVTLLLQVFFAGHLMACILYGMSTVITAHPWYEVATTAYPSQVDASLASKYILSLYWTFTIMATVGYGDILPNNTAERLLNVFVILLGASMFGYMLANVSSLIQSFTSTDTVKDERIAGITVYLDEKQTPLKLQDAVVKHFRNYFKHASPFDVDAMLGRLPQKLANEILLIHNGTTLKSIAILRYIENVSVRLYIFNLMKPVYYEPNEYMLQQGSSGQEIMFIVEGGALAFKKAENVDTDTRLKRFERPKLQREKSVSLRFGSLLNMSSPSTKDRERAYSLMESPQGFAAEAVNRNRLAKATKVQMQSGVFSDEFESTSGKDTRNKSFSFGADTPTSSAKERMERKKSILKHDSAYSKPVSPRSGNLELSDRKKSIMFDASTSESPSLKGSNGISLTRKKSSKVSLTGSGSASASASIDDADAGTDTPTRSDPAVFLPITNSDKDKDAEKKDDDGEDIIQLDTIYRNFTLDDHEFSPGMYKNSIARPNSKLRFNVNGAPNSKKSKKFEASDSSADDSEYETLRRAQTPQALQARNGNNKRNKRSKHKTAARVFRFPSSASSASSVSSHSSKSSKSSIAEHPAAAPRSLLYTFSDMDMKKSHKVRTAAEEYEDTDDEDSDDDEHVHVDAAFKWTEANMQRKGLKPIGALAPGNFVGHLAVMHDSTNDASVVTTTFSTVYVLQKQDITSILTTQPSVSIQLQMAMSRAISTQSDTLGKLHMRQNRSKFLIETKEKFYTQLAVKPVEVKRIRKAQKNKMTRMAHGIKKLRKPGDKEDRPTKELTRMNGVIADKDSFAKTSSEKDATHSNDITSPASSESFFSKFTHADGITPTRALPKAVVRKVKQVERVLTKYSMLYDSDGATNEGTGHHSTEAALSKKHRIHAHRSQLPLKVTLRATAFPPVTATMERPPVKRRRSSFNLLSGHAPDGLVASREPSVASLETRPSTSTIMTTNRHSFLQRFAGKTLAAKKEVKRRNRVMSLNDLDMLEPTSSLQSLMPRRAIPRHATMAVTRPPFNAMVNVIVPTYSNHVALQRSTEALLRRQSFPSLENDLWKIGVTSQGIL